MKKFEPLKGFSLVDTNRVEEAEAEISRSLTTSRIIRLTDRNRFQLRMNKVNFGSHTGRIDIVRSGKPQRYRCKAKLFSDKN